MSPAVRARLFEPFFTTKEHGRGTGLGLVTVHSIVTQAGGGISVSSEEGNGSTFSVWLPAVAPPEQASLGIALPTNEINGTETILVVEDNASLRRFVERTLATHGYRPLGAASVAHAMMLWAARSDAIDLVLTDVVMPDRSGPSFAEWVRQQRPGMPVVFMSGYAAASDTRPVDVPLLQKPFSSIDLLHAIRNALIPARRDALHGDQT
jgi:CheY-like chemotaxis protein